MDTEIVLSAEDWEDFTTALERPPRYLPRLAALLREETETVAGGPVYRWP